MDDDKLSGFKLFFNVVSGFNLRCKEDMKIVISFCLLVLLLVMAFMFSFNYIKLERASAMEREFALEQKMVEMFELGEIFKGIDMYSRAQYENKVLQTMFTELQILNTKIERLEKERTLKETKNDQYFFPAE